MCEVKFDISTSLGSVVYYLLIEMYKQNISSDFVEEVKDLTTVEQPDLILLDELLSTCELKTAELLDDRVNMLISNKKTKARVCQALFQTSHNGLTELDNIIDKYLL
jgi:hypothetical protein